MNLHRALTSGRSFGDDDHHGYGGDDLLVGYGYGGYGYGVYGGGSIFGGGYGGSKP